MEYVRGIAPHISYQKKNNVDDEIVYMNQYDICPISIMNHDAISVIHGIHVKAIWSERRWEVRRTFIPKPLHMYS